MCGFKQYFTLKLTYLSINLDGPKHRGNSPVILEVTFHFFFTDVVKRTKFGKNFVLNPIKWHKIVYVVNRISMKTDELFPCKREVLLKNTQAT